MVDQLLNYHFYDPPFLPGVYLPSDGLHLEPALMQRAIGRLVSNWGGLRVSLPTPTNNYWNNRISFPSREYDVIHRRPRLRVTYIRREESPPDGSDAPPIDYD